ncbi:unnamed protein product [marine sediment metagenome]|uniref:Uncharacterized protein n=1 Tax=marine sediment metagenome TaxID=412755 RepID=X0TE07_9ZZZZ
MSDGDQMRLTGMWKEYGERCPHYRSDPDGVGRCLNNEMRSCEYELGNFCQEWRDILEEWHKEAKDLCQTCFKLRPGDERVAEGKPCEVCAGDGTLPARIRSLQGRER